MHNKKREIVKLFGFIIILLPLLMMPTILFGGKADNKPERNSESQADYILTIKGNLISLKAKNASVKDILEEIGRRMKIEVVANISREEKITVELGMMYLGDAIKRFRTNYAYITESEEEKGKITKIVVVPKGLGMPIISQKKSVVKERREFGYNPQPSVQTNEVPEEKRMVDPGIKERTFDDNSQPSIQPYEATKEKKIVTPRIRPREDAGTEEPSHTEPSEFEYNPQPSLQ